MWRHRVEVNYSSRPVEEGREPRIIMFDDLPMKSDSTWSFRELE